MAIAETIILVGILIGGIACFPLIAISLLITCISRIKSKYF